MKKFAIILLVLVLVLTFVACGGNTDTPSTEESSVEATASTEETSSSAVGGDNDAAMPDSWFTTDEK